MDSERSIESAWPRRSVTSEQLSGIYASWSPRAMQLAMMLCPDRSAAEDLVQEAFVRCLARFRRIDQVDDPEAFLHRTLINLARSRWRRLKVERRYLAGQEAPRIDQPTSDVRLDLWEAIRRLPHRQRAALYLRYYEQASYEQIAQSLGTTVGAVRSLLRNALSHLRRSEEADDD